MNEQGYMSLVASNFKIDPSLWLREESFNQVDGHIQDLICESIRDTITQDCNQEQEQEVAECLQQIIDSVYNEALDEPLEESLFRNVTNYKEMYERLSSKDYNPRPQEKETLKELAKCYESAFIRAFLSLLEKDCTSSDGKFLKCHARFLATITNCYNALITQAGSYMMYIKNMSSSSSSGDEPYDPQMDAKEWESFLSRDGLQDFDSQQQQQQQEDDQNTQQSMVRRIVRVILATWTVFRLLFERRLGEDKITQAFKSTKELESLTKQTSSYYVYLLIVLVDKSSFKLSKKQQQQQQGTQQLSQSLLSQVLVSESDKQKLLAYYRHCKALLDVIENNGCDSMRTTVFKDLYTILKNERDSFKQTDAYKNDTSHFLLSETEDINSKSFESLGSTHYMYKHTHQPAHTCFGGLRIENKGHVNRHSDDYTRSVLQTVHGKPITITLASYETALHSSSNLVFESTTGYNTVFSNEVEFRSEEDANHINMYDFMVLQSNLRSTLLHYNWALRSKAKHASLFVFEADQVGPDYVRHRMANRLFEKSLALIKTHNTGGITDELLFYEMCKISGTSQDDRVQSYSRMLYNLFQCMKRVLEYAWRSSKSILCKFKVFEYLIESKGLPKWFVPNKSTANDAHDSFSPYWFRKEQGTNKTETNLAQEEEEDKKLEQAIKSTQQAQERREQVDDMEASLFVLPGTLFRKDVISKDSGELILSFFQECILSDSYWSDIDEHVVRDLQNICQKHIQTATEIKNKAKVLMQKQEHSDMKGFLSVLAFCIEETIQKRDYFEYLAPFFDGNKKEYKNPALAAILEKMQ